MTMPSPDKTADRVLSVISKIEGPHEQMVKVATLDPAKKQLVEDNLTGMGGCKDSVKQAASLFLGQQLGNAPSAPSPSRPGFGGRGGASVTDE